jgi:hypothetical protein
MQRELRITIELLDSETVRDPIASEQVLVGIEVDDGFASMEDGGMGDIEAEIDGMLLDNFGGDED